MKYLIKNAKMVNEGQCMENDLLICNDRIDRIGRNISEAAAHVIDAEGKYLLPGLIDDQVHFREPGLTHKGSIESESRAAVAGGTTSFIEMPNTLPQTVTVENLEEKFRIASRTSWGNYSFSMGATNDNIEEVLKVDHRRVAGLKIFLGASTGNMLVDDPVVLENIFRRTPLRISVHCEHEPTVKQNMRSHLERYGDDIPMRCHPEIRSDEACFLSSSEAIALAEKTGARLHVFHLSTARETSLLDNSVPLHKKQITAEVCTHHLWFSDEDYADKGSLIKWNPAVKTAADRSALWEALLDDRIDVLATDHAPHALEEKQQVYTKAPSGGPLVQHALVALLECFQNGQISLPKIVEKACHNPAVLFEIAERGFLREGYKADLVLVDPDAPWTVTPANILYKCGWSPFEGTTFRSRITHTFVNGVLAYAEGRFPDRSRGERLVFERP